MKRFLVALQFLTRLPTPPAALSGDDFARSMRWFPAVGLIIGLIIAAVSFAGSRIDDWTGAAMALLIWVLVTGALHLDGLGDMADAAGALHKSGDGTHDKERLSAILADPHVGSFGVTAIALLLIVKLVLLHALIDRGLFAGLACIPFAARIAPLVWTCWLPPLHEGLGARFRGAIRPVHLMIWGAALLIASFFFPALILLIPVIALWGWWIVQRIGGISGDGHGAGIEIAEAVLLFALIATAGPQ